MSAALISTLNFVSQQITIYLGISTVIAGIIGGFLIIVVFLSLRTFRQNSCAFYLTVMSIVNIGQMLTGLLSRVMDNGFSTDWSLSSLFYCKFRYYCFQVCALTSMSCMCLATIDQYLSTCSSPRWQQRSNIKIAHRLTAILILIWMLHNIPYLVYYNQVVSTSTGQITCVFSNDNFQQYSTYGINFILGKLIPVCITFLFGFLAYRNVQDLAHRALPLARRELDKQLTIMVLVQVVFGWITVVPYSITSFIARVVVVPKNTLIYAQLQCAAAVTACFFYMYFASPFYIFLCVSDRFRRQLAHVLFRVYINQWRQRILRLNQVIPQVQ